MGKNKTESWSVQADYQTKERAIKILNELKGEKDRTIKTAFITMLDIVEFNLRISERNSDLKKALEKFDQSLCDVRKNAQDLVEKQISNVQELESSLEKKEVEYEELKERNAALIQMEEKYLDLKGELDRYKELLKFKDAENEKLKKEIAKLKEKKKKLQQEIDEDKQMSFVDQLK